MDSNFSNYVSPSSYAYPQQTHVYDQYNYYNSPILNPSYNSISEFLANLGEAFLEYENNFIEHGYSIEELPYLNMNQLQSIGITKLGHCTRILVALGLPNF